MQSRQRKCFALGGMMALLVTSQSPPVQSQNLVAINKPTTIGTASRQAAAKDGAGGDSTQFKGADGSGTLVAMAVGGKQLGQCPLKHTDVSCDISGYVARVTVKQTFHNPFKDKMEAVYTFPLSESGAVDEMLMKVGDRTIHGTIKKREEARQIYEQARAHGQVASLLDQERTNIFTQSVANIEPGKEIEITIKYVETLPFEKGKYTFAFPTVVGPRFNPGNATGHSGTGRADDTSQVPDASRITPPVAPPGERSGHDISINVHLNAGMAISDLTSRLHQVNIANQGSQQANISLVGKNTIPNKDFVLTWDVSQDSLKSGYLTYRDPKESKDGFFTLMLVPPKRVTVDNVAPKEMIFVIDCSGSQSGPPLEKCKETMNYILDHMNPDDTFQIIAFSSSTRSFAPHPQRVSAEMKNRAHQFINSLEANGGTWMAPAVEEACKIPADANRLRIVTFMTDGYVGNDFEVMGMVKKLRGLSRWFPFGTGNSVNRMLIDGIAKEGGGEPDYVLLNTSGEAAGKKFYDRIASPVLTDVKVKFDGVNVKDVFPREVSDVWAQRPLYFKGKYTAGGAGTVTLTGFAAGKPYEQKLQISFPESSPANPGIASLWARAKVDRLMSEDYAGAQSGNPNKELKDEIVATALARHIMTQYTSFVAVDEKTITKDGKLITVPVQVEVPDGVSREKTIGGAEGALMMQRQALGGKNKQGSVQGYMQRFPYAGASFHADAVSSASPMRSVRARTLGGGGGGVGGAMPTYGNGIGYAPASFAQAPPGYPGAPMVANAYPANKPIAGPAETKSLSADLRLQGKGNEGRGVYRKDFAENSKLPEPLKEHEALAFKNGVAGDKKGVASAKDDSVDLAKLSPAARALLKNPSMQVAGLTRKGDRVCVIVKVNSVTPEMKAAFKKVGLEIASGKETQGEVHGLIKISKLLALANLDFVLSVLLESDHK